MTHPDPTTLTHPDPATPTLILPHRLYHVLYWIILYYTVLLDQRVIGSTGHRVIGSSGRRDRRRRDRRRRDEIRRGGGGESVDPGDRENGQFDQFLAKIGQFQPVYALRPVWG